MAAAVGGRPEQSRLARAGIDLGVRLFFDPRLSQTGTVSCASCHVPEKNWSDGRKLGVGLQDMDRNTPSIVNLRHSRWFGWDGLNDTLWAQSMRPMLEAREMAATESHIAQVMRGDLDLACRYEQAFRRALPADDEIAHGRSRQGARRVPGNAGDGPYAFR